MTIFEIKKCGNVVTIYTIAHIIIIFMIFRRTSNNYNNLTVYQEATI